MLELIGEAGVNAFRTGCDECMDQDLFGNGEMEGRRDVF